MTGLPALRQARTMRFWIVGTCSGGISTPRSPRATMIASAVSTMGSRLRMAIGFSSLATMPACPCTIALISRMSSARWTKDSATQSTPSARPKARSALSLAVSADSGRTTPGTLTPLRSDTVPPAITLVCAKSGPHASTRRRTRPSSMSRSVPASSAANISGCGSGARAASPAVAVSRSSRKAAPSSSRTGPAAKVPRRNLGPCKSIRMPTGRLNSRSMRRMNSWLRR
ncbi:hypothetical protein SDC9_155774 [bioreactor metagenome]|uniref:Uncharacterized protein n=1 Tax=bioreactor metagenome TaxID=1076179 RepID=A0A645F4P9_9ZZZZ